MYSRLSPTISLEAPAAILKGSGKYLLAITTTGTVNIWDTQTLKSKIASSSIASQFNLPSVGALSKIDLSDNGSPILAFSGGTTLGWSEGLQTWVRIHESWWREGSDVDAAPEQNDGKPKAFRAALTLGHLETRIAASLMVGSGEQWRDTVVDYARRLASESYVERAEELVRELAGPVFWYVPTLFFLSLNAVLGIHLPITGTLIVQTRGRRLGNQPLWGFQKENCCKRKYFHY